MCVPVFLVDRRSFFLRWTLSSGFVGCKLLPLLTRQPEMGDIALFFILSSHLKVLVMAGIINFHILLDSTTVQVQWISVWISRPNVKIGCTTCSFLRKVWREVFILDNKYLSCRSSYQDGICTNRKAISSNFLHINISIWKKSVMWHIQFWRVTFYLSVPGTAQSLHFLLLQSLSHDKWWHARGPGLPQHSGENVFYNLMTLYKPAGHPKIALCEKIPLF